jgi:hypothetical protein
VAASALCAALAGPAAIAGGGPTGVYNEAPRVAAPPYLAFEQSRERARAAGLLPEPELRLPYTGARTAPPPITADLPPSTGRQTIWAEVATDTDASASAPAHGDVTLERRAGRR